MIKPAPSANEAWLELCFNLSSHGDFVAPQNENFGSDSATRELMGISTTVDMTRPILNLRERKLSFKFMFGEAWWILSGRNDVEGIRPYSKRIEQVSDNGFDFYGAYGPKIVNQLDYVIDTLIKDPQSRRAVLTIWRENPHPTKDYPCTVSVQWLIRNGRLHCIDTMRSSDVWLGWPYDVFNFSMLSILIAIRLRENGNLNVELGHLKLQGGSQHLYLRDFEKIKNCLLKPEEGDYVAPILPEQFHSSSGFVAWLKSQADFYVASQTSQTASS